MAKAQRTGGLRPKGEDAPADPRQLTLAAPVTTAPELAELVVTLDPHDPEGTAKRLLARDPKVVLSQLRDEPRAANPIAIVKMKAPIAVQAQAEVDHAKNELRDLIRGHLGVVAANGKATWSMVQGQIDHVALADALLQQFVPPEQHQAMREAFRRKDGRQLRVDPK